MEDQRDWRYRVVTTLTENAILPSGKIAKKGSYVSVSSFFKRYGKEISIGDPSASALFLSQAYKSFQIAGQFEPKKFFLEEDIENENLCSEIIYDYLENIIASIIFAYTSIEAFANEEIPSTYIYEEAQGKGGIVVPRKKDYIERFVNLDIKLSSILPSLKNCSSPKGFKIWSDYKKLKNYRDRLIHLKSSDRKHSTMFDNFPDSIWKELLTTDLINYAHTAKTIILHFVKNGNLPYWIENCPF